MILFIFIWGCNSNCLIQQRTRKNSQQNERSYSASMLLITWIWLFFCLLSAIDYKIMRFQLNIIRTYNILWNLCLTRYRPMELKFYYVIGVYLELVFSTFGADECPQFKVRQIGLEFSKEYDSFYCVCQMYRWFAFLSLIYCLRLLNASPVRFIFLCVPIPNLIALEIIFTFAFSSIIHVRVMHMSFVSAVLVYVSILR